ncbi:natriuretic peptides B [Acanthochromis polyacanthus]|uniref:Brain natriuretic peptide-like n=1 Tax=Acanthochromis polyacanthus TaxID=80966 RepID=A0A3Q1FAX4_9TELE|nr:natriuretic peptides B [Acanthochromis polyacanthus]
MNTSSSHRNMHLSSILLFGLLLILNLPLSSAYPISSGLSDADMGTLKMLLHRLEESISEQPTMDQRNPADEDSLDGLSKENAADRHNPQPQLNEAVIREFLSVKNLKSLGKDSSRRSSGCFGRRMDRIDSMSSLGCNIVGRNSKFH